MTFSVSFESIGLHQKEQALPLKLLQPGCSEPFGQIHWRKESVQLEDLSDGKELLFATEGKQASVVRLGSGDKVLH